jgi:hypothetical protein
VVVLHLAFDNRHIQSVRVYTSDLCVPMRTAHSAGCWLLRLVQQDTYYAQDTVDRLHL